MDIKIDAEDEDLLLASLCWSFFIRTVGEDAAKDVEDFIFCCWVRVVSLLLVCKLDGGSNGERGGGGGVLWWNLRKIVVSLSICCARFFCVLRVRGWRVREFGSLGVGNRPL